MIDMPQVLLEDFDFYRRKTARFALLEQRTPFIGKKMKMNPKRRKLLEGMIAWCAEQKLEPRYWLFCLFKASEFRWGPRWDGSLCSAATLKRHRFFKGFAIFRERLQMAPARDDAAPAEELPGVDPRRDIIPLVEALKSRYAATAQSARCYEEPERTLGFHPKSRTCQRCPHRTLCCERLIKSVAYDIFALREGRITIQQAEGAERAFHEYGTNH